MSDYPLAALILQETSYLTRYRVRTNTTRVIVK